MTILVCPRCGSQDTGTFCSTCGRELAHENQYRSLIAEFSEPISNLRHILYQMRSPQTFVSRVQNNNITLKDAFRLYSYFTLVAAFVGWITGAPSSMGEVLNEQLKTTVFNIFDAPLIGEIVKSIYIAFFLTAIVWLINRSLRKTKLDNKYLHAYVITMSTGAIGLPIVIPFPISKAVEYGTFATLSYYGLILLALIWQMRFFGILYGRTTFSAVIRYLVGSIVVGILGGLVFTLIIIALFSAGVLVP